MSVTPRSIAERMVRIDSSRSDLPPHIQPPIAHVPRAIREAVSPDVPIAMVSMARRSRGGRSSACVGAARRSPPDLSLALEEDAIFPLLPLGEIANAMKTSAMDV